MKKVLTNIALTVLVLASVLLNADRSFAATIGKPANNNSLVGFWPFDDGAGTIGTDHSGYGNAATLTCTGSGCAIPTWITGKRGKALDFGYVSSSVYPLVSIPATVPAASGNVITVSAWYYNKGGGTDPRIVNRGWCASMGWLMHLGLGFGVNNSTGCSAQYWASFGGLETGRWYHLTGVFDGTNVYSYKDGVLMNTTSTSGVNLANNSYTIEMMTANNGKLDDVRIYNRVLSASEIARLYKAGQATHKVADNRGLVGYWTFNEGSGLLAGDFSGNGYGGTLVNGPTWVNGKKGKALSFDNVDDYVDAGDQAELDFGTGDFTIAAFQTKNSHTARALVEKRGTGLVGYMLSEEYPSTGNITLFLNDTSASQKLYTFPSASLSQFGLDAWFHIAVVVMRSTNTAYLYLNGVQASSVSISGTTGSVTSDASFRIGYDAGGVKFNGKIDDLRMYDRALSASEIAALYGANEVKVNAPQDSKLSSGLVGYWTFNGKDLTSTTASDVSGIGLHGTLGGTPTPTIGKVGQALSFNGTSAQVEIPYNAALAPAAAVSFGGWFRSNDLTGGQRILSKTETGGFQLSLNENGVCASSTLCALVYVGGYHKADYAISNLSTNEWYHAFATYDGETIRLYLNGVEVANATSPSGAIGYSTANSLCIGSEPGSTCNAGSYFKGSLDEIRVYNTALTAAQVKQLYLMGK